MSTEDKYVNQAYISVVESAINTLTFKKLETGISIYEKVGWLISRIDYSIGITPANFSSDGASIEAGVSVSSQITDVSLSQDAVIDRIYIRRSDFGVAATSMLFQLPITKDFSRLAGGGLLIPPNPIYLFGKGTGLGVVETVQVRMFYTVKQLKTEDFWELVEQRRMITTQ